MDHFSSPLCCPPPGVDSTHSPHPLSNIHIHTSRRRSFSRIGRPSSRAGPQHRTCLSACRDFELVPLHSRKLTVFFVLLGWTRAIFTIMNLTRDSGIILIWHRLDGLMKGRRRCRDSYLKLKSWRTTQNIIATLPDPEW